MGLGLSGLRLGLGQRGGGGVPVANYVVDDGWGLAVGWTSVDGVLTADGAVGTMSQDMAPQGAIPGDVYTVSFETSGSYVGGLRLRFGSPSANDATITTDGAHSYELTLDPGFTLISFRVGSLNDFVGSVSGILVQKVVSSAITLIAAGTIIQAGSMIA